MFIYVVLLEVKVLQVLDFDHSFYALCYLKPQSEPLYMGFQVTGFKCILTLFNNHWLVLVTVWLPISILFNTLWTKVSVRAINACLMATSDDQSNILVSWQYQPWHYIVSWWHLFLTVHWSSFWRNNWNYCSRKRNFLCNCLHNG